MIIIISSSIITTTTTTIIIIMSVVMFTSSISISIDTISTMIVLITPGLHSKIPAHKIFARVWVAQEPFFSQVAAKTFQGLGPKRRESCYGDRG